MTFKQPQQDAPDRWNQYRDLLEQMPERQAPAGSMMRLNAHLAEAMGSGNRRRHSNVRWVVASACSMALVAIIWFGSMNGSLDPNDNGARGDQAATVKSKSSKTTGRNGTRRPTTPERLSPPPVPIDTSIPFDIVINQAPLDPADPGSFEASKERGIAQDVVPGLPPSRAHQSPGLTR